MAEFHANKLEVFLGVVRKYMQVRGNLSQKDLAELTEVGVSTMSRFLNQKTTELNAQLISKIVAKLNIPLHEIIDFVDESYADKFVRLVKFYKDEAGSGEELNLDEVPEKTETLIQAPPEDLPPPPRKVEEPTRTERASEKTQEKTGEKSLKERLEKLTPRQRVFLMEFLELDVDGRDLMVDIGNNLFRYIKQKGMNF